MLSTTYHPMSSMLWAACDRPAPLMPVMSMTSNPSAGAVASGSLANAGCPMGAVDVIVPPPVRRASRSPMCGLGLGMARHQQHLGHRLIQ